MLQCMRQLCRLRAPHTLCSRLLLPHHAALPLRIRRSLKTPSTRHVAEKQKKEDASTHPPWTSAEPEEDARDQDENEKSGEKRPLFAFEKREVEDRATAALPHISVEEFVRLSAAGKATPEQALSCVYNRRNEIFNLPLPLPEKREKSAAQQVGGRVLHWLWSQPMSVRDELSMNRPFVKSLCYFLVAEDREDFVFQWLKIELANEKRNIDRPGRHLWLAGLVEAQHAWTDSVVLPITTLRKALVEFRGKHLFHVLLAANVAVGKMVQSYHTPSYPPELFDALVAVNSATTTRERKIWTEASLFLFHPTKPDANSFLKLLRTRTVTAWVPWDADEAIRNSWGSYAFRAAYILRLQGLPQDASWLEAIVEEKTPKVWFTRERIRAECDLDPKLDELRRKARIDQDLQR